MGTIAPAGGCSLHPPDRGALASLGRSVGTPAMVVKGDSVRHRDRRSELRPFSTCHARTLDGAEPLASMLSAPVENGRGPLRQQSLLELPPHRYRPISPRPECHIRTRAHLSHRYRNLTSNDLHAQSGRLGQLFGRNDGVDSERHTGVQMPHECLHLGWCPSVHEEQAGCCGTS